MRYIRRLLLLSVIVLYVHAFAQSDTSVTWILDNVDSIGGNPTIKTGDPVVIETPIGPAVLFNGIDDDLLVKANIIKGVTTFTLEAIFRPDSIENPNIPGNIQKEQRYLHIEKRDTTQKTNRRILFETRITDNNKWWADSFVKYDSYVGILAPKQKFYSLGEWHHHALVFDGDSLYHYIDGVNDTTTAGTWGPIDDAYTSIGVRMDLRPIRDPKSWFKGAIHMIKGINRVLDPSEFTRTDTIATAIKYNIMIASDYKLYQNYPNPFNPVTIIKYELPITDYVELNIYNLLGQKIATLVNKKQTAGTHQVEWNAERFASGVYYYIMRTGDFNLTRKMVLIK